MAQTAPDPQVRTTAQRPGTSDRPLRVDQRPPARHGADAPDPPTRRVDRATVLTWVMATALLALGFGLRLYRLALPIDRDSYDEGVYWQTLRALDNGDSLYRPVFGSQPPMSQLAILPIYKLFGSTLWSARFAGVLLSMAGVAAAYVIGKRLGGRTAGLAAMLLTAAEPLYVRQSRTFQAETPALAFSLIAVAAALVWLDHPTGRRGRMLAIGCGAALACAILSKLTGVATLVPVAAVIGQHALSRRRDGRRPESSVLLIPLGLLAVGTIIVAPFLRQFDEMWTGVVTFHIDAADVFRPAEPPHGGMIGRTLVSWLGAAALLGTVVAALRRDGRVIAGLAWLIVSAAFLYQHVPLFDHHMTTLVPPLVMLSAFAFRLPPSRVGRTGQLWTAALVLSALLLVAASVDGLQTVADRYRFEQETLETYERTIYQAVDDLRTYTQPEDRVITDAQFIAALADRDTPPNLVDTSDIRIRTDLLTADELIEQASAPDVRAVLLFPRLFDPLVHPFYDWMTQHFRLVADYGGGRSLWIR